MDAQKDGWKTGWAQTDITPDQKVFIQGQFHARISEGVLDPVTASVLAMESVKNGRPRDCAVMVSCDLVGISDELRDAVRERVQALLPDFDTGKIFVGATHTHTAPQTSTGREYGIELDAMDPEEYIEWAADKIAGAVQEAWEKREISAVGYGMGYAVVGRNRRLTSKDGSTKMYGKAGRPDFSHVEGYEDHSVYVMMTYDENKNLTGMVVNVACPSQVSEHLYQISADYWHETREELRRRFGDDLYVLAQCAPAGDQSPHVLIGKRAEERMWRLKGRDTDQNAPRDEIAQRIADAVGDILPYAEKELEWDPHFAHKYEKLDLPRRMISKEDVEEAVETARPFKEEYEKLAKEIENNPEMREEPRWYKEITRSYRKMNRGEQVKERFEMQQSHPNMPIEVHAVVVGDVAFATNPFELYLDYGVRIRELSKATQTFLMQKAGSRGTYLPSARSIGGKGYGTVPASTEIGPEGGDKLVDWTVKTINELGHANG